MLNQERRNTLRTVFYRSVLPIGGIYLLTFILGTLIAVQLPSWSLGWWAIPLGVLAAIYIIVGLHGFTSVLSNWKTIRDCTYPNIDAQAEETWDLAAWLATNPMFADTPERASRQQALQQALTQYRQTFQNSMPEQVTEQLNRLERLMHETDWTGQYAHALLYYRQLKDSHLKYWKPLDDAYRQTMQRLMDGERLENMRQNIQLSKHRMVVLNGLQIACPTHNTTGANVTYEDGGAL